MATRDHSTDKSYLKTYLNRLLKVGIAAAVPLVTQIIAWNEVCARFPLSCAHWRGAVEHSEECQTMETDYPGPTLRLPLIPAKEPTSLRLEDGSNTSTHVLQCLWGQMRKKKYGQCLACRKSSEQWLLHRQLVAAPGDSTCFHPLLWLSSLCSSMQLIQADTASVNSQKFPSRKEQDVFN